MKGKLNKDALEYALQNIVNRHEVLRTVIKQEEGKAYQKIKDEGGWKLQYIDGSVYKDNVAELQRYIEQLIAIPFDLSEDYMIRGHLISMSEEDHLIVVNLHHIASDGWSRSILVKELAELYESYEESREVNLLPLPLQYADYAIWQRNYLQGEVLDKKLGYWKEKLDGVETIQLPTDYTRPAVQSTKGAAKEFQIEKDLSDKLLNLSQQNGTTLFMTLHAAFKVLLYRYSGQHDICIGSPIAGRQQKEVEGLFGFFVNSLALRSNVNGNLSFTEFLHQVRVTTLEAYENQEIPFETVVDSVMKGRDISRNPLFQVMFTLQNTPDIKQLHLREVELSRYDYEHTTSMFDISVFLTEIPAGLQGLAEYCTDLFNEQTIERMIDHFKELLSSIVKEPDQKIESLSMITGTEKHKVLVEFNNTRTDYPFDKSIVDLFEEQVLKTPDSIALIFEENQLTYRELDERSNRLAQYLRTKGVRDEMLVPVCMERSLELIVGILGIIKAGGVYVPIDPNYPEDRISFMLKDTGCPIVVTTSHHSQHFDIETQSAEILCIDSMTDVLSQFPIDKLDNTVRADKLAYVMYTSGSTGKPKGVMVEHGNVVSLVKGTDYVSLTKNDILLSTGSPSFDATTFEYWGMLLNGGQLILCDENTLLDCELLKAEIVKRGVNKMWFVASLFNQMVETDLTLFETLDTILVGGEKLSEPHIKKIKERYPSIDIINGYGPTENTTFSLTYKITDLKTGTSIPIGSPLNNRSAYILDHRQQLVGVGVPGEIYVGGAGLARGYLNRPELTAEKFIKNPFSEEPEQNYTEPAIWADGFLMQP